MEDTGSSWGVRVERARAEKGKARRARASREGSPGRESDVRSQGEQESVTARPRSAGESTQRLLRTRLASVFGRSVALRQVPPDGLGQRQLFFFEHARGE